MNKQKSGLLKKSISMIAAAAMILGMPVAAGGESLLPSIGTVVAAAEGDTGTPMDTPADTTTDTPTDTSTDKPADTPTEAASYKITVTNGTATPSTAKAGDTVIVIADTKDGQTFKQWFGFIGNTNCITFDNSASTSTTFTMPASDVNIVALFDEKKTESHSITVTGATANYTSALKGTIVTLTPNSSRNFRYWNVISGGITISNNQFVMPDTPVSIQAVYWDDDHSYHTLSSWQYNSDYHWRHCYTCNEDYYTGGHTSNGGVVTTSPTYYSTGVRTYSCTVCGYVLRKETIPTTSNYYYSPYSYKYYDYYPYYYSYSPYYGYYYSPYYYLNGYYRNTKAELDAMTIGNSVTLSWNKRANADSYTVYVSRNGGDYEVLKQVKGNKLVFRGLKNGEKYKFMLRYNRNGRLYETDSTGTVSVSVYYKPDVKISADSSGIKLSWKKVSDADKYAVYKIVNGKARFLSETKNTAVRIVGTSSGENSYAVSAFVDGEWTTMLASDVVTVITD